MERGRNKGTLRDVFSPFFAPPIFLLSSASTAAESDQRTTTMWRFSFLPLSFPFPTSTHNGVSFLPVFLPAAQKHLSPVSV